MIFQLENIEFLSTVFGYRRLVFSPFIPPLVKYGNQWRFENTSDSIGNCSFFNSLKSKNLKELGKGFNKVVFKDSFENVAIKKISFSGNSFVTCMDNADGNFKSEFDCIETAARGFITEIGLMLSLQGDPNVPKLYAYCIPLDFVLEAESLSSATSVGEPLDVIHLAQSDWKNRVKIIDEILKFLKRTKPLVFNDLRRQQFVLIENHPTLVDFDDVGFIPLENQRRSDFYDYGNDAVVRRLYSAFIDGLLFQSNPPGTEESLKELKKAYENSTLTLEKLTDISSKLRNFI
ncbi:hypothetical protein FO519_002937 [Halicephalobus sp. NKZ332]|nr:hypothetical protein FO519_002937 [Halicephalobus sp. NKZ332]